MTPDQLSAAVLDTVHASIATGDLSATVPAEVKVERPRNREHGDYATSVALQLAKSAGRPPREVAELLATGLRAKPGIAAVDIAGPGFLNLTLDKAAQGELARTIVTAGEAYGRNDSAAGQRINLEFVSANPTGPVHLGATRWAAVGDALARVLGASGAQVIKEYYFNDAGSQIDRFARSLYAVSRGEGAPGDGYGGAYIADIATEVLSQRPELKDLAEPEAVEGFRVAGVELMFRDIRASLADFGVVFDVYFNEKDLHDQGKLDHALARLREQGNIADRDGAVWLLTEARGDDKDRVLVKSDGEPTYFLADCAYYLDKRERGFDKVVIMLGADHHGYIGRMKAMVACFGDDPEQNLEILIGQMVNLLKDGQAVRMSKRAGTVITLEDLVEAVGADAARYALARSSADSQLDIDLDLLTRHTSDNPVYYVQYAHARIASLLRNAEALGIDRGELQPGLLVEDGEGDLLGALGEFGRVVASAAELREPHRVARYLEDLAGTYHKFYDVCRVLPMGEDEATDLNRARLWLCDATRVVLANGLALLGVTAPERM